MNEPHDLEIDFDFFESFYNDHLNDEIEEAMKGLISKFSDIKHQVSTATLCKTILDYAIENQESVPKRSTPHSK